MRAMTLTLAALFPLATSLGLYWLCDGEFVRPPGLGAAVAFGLILAPTAIAIVKAYWPGEKG